LPATTMRKAPGPLRSRALPKGDSRDSPSHVLSVRPVDSSDQQRVRAGPRRVKSAPRARRQPAQADAQVFPFFGSSHRRTNGRAPSRTTLAALSPSPVSPMTGMEQRSVRVGGPLGGTLPAAPEPRPPKSGQCLARVGGCGKRRGKSRRRKESRLNNIAQAANTARRETGSLTGRKTLCTQEARVPERRPMSAAPTPSRRAANTVEFPARLALSVTSVARRRAGSPDQGRQNRDRGRDGIRNLEVNLTGGYHVSHATFQGFHAR
jgi:hypothetical protein